MVQLEHDVEPRRLVFDWEAPAIASMLGSLNTAVVRPDQEDRNSILWELD